MNEFIFLPRNWASSLETGLSLGDYISFLKSKLHKVSLAFLALTPVCLPAG